MRQECGAAGLTDQPGQRAGGVHRAGALGHRSPEVVWDDEPIGVQSWRPAPLELTTAPSEDAAPQSTYAGNPYSFAGHRWPADGGRQL